MNDVEAEAKRLAQQRKDDISDLQDREREREYLRGKREAEIEAHTKGQDEHLTRINGSIDDFTKALDDIGLRMTALEKSYTTASAVAAAIADKAVSTRTFVFGVLTLLLPIIILVVTILTTTGK